MKQALICAALVAAACCYAPASAQTMSPGTPVGISVDATASVTPTAFVVQIPFERKASSASADGASAVAQFRAALATAGIPSSAIVSATPFGAPTATSVLPFPAAGTDAQTVIAIATLRLDPGKVASTVKTLAATHWTPASGGARLIPVDEESLKDEALAKATGIARHRAEAIAAAEGRHVGRLLNVAAEPFDFLSSLFGDLSQLSPFFGSAGIPEVKAGGVFTFELLP